MTEDEFVDNGIWKPVESSVVKAIMYEADKERLHVILQAGEYVYEAVPSIVAREFFRSSSKGRYYSRQVKGHFPHP